MASVRVLAFIPARAGSRRVPNKNLRLLNGLPLIHYTIEQAKASPLIDKIVVSSDSEKILAYARSCGVIGIPRPSSISGDASPTVDAVRHALDVLAGENYVPDCVVILQPTSPLRSADDITSCVRLYQNGSIQTVVSVVEANPFWTLKKTNKEIMPVLGWDYFKLRKQDLPKAYALNGAVFVARTDYLRKNALLVGRRTKLYEMPPERSIDIDEEIDFAFAEFLLGRR